MLICDAALLAPFRAEHRLWQGIPAIERTAGGRLFAAFYSGGETECMGNYAVVVKSDDGGSTFSEPIAAAWMGENARAFDAALWIDPLGRLWFVWAVMPECRAEFSVCPDPDAETLVWEPVRTLGHDIMLNKPIVTSQGDWLFPLAVWAEGLTAGLAGGSDGLHETGAHVVRSRDLGASFEKIGTVVAPGRWFDEHMLIERSDGTLAMYIRTRYGIGRAVSPDGGASWSGAADSGLGGPNSRFFIGRLRSGRILLVNHADFTGRNNLTAMLSEDDGATFPYRLCIDSRANVSYPDAVEGSDGFLYIVYDHERGAKYSPDEDYSGYAREILLAKITQEDILSGAVTDKDSRLGMVVSRLKPSAPRAEERHS